MPSTCHRKVPPLRGAEHSSGDAAKKRRRIDVVVTNASIPIGQNGVVSLFDVPKGIRVISGEGETPLSTFLDDLLTKGFNLL